MEHENSSAISLIVVILGPTIFIFQSFVQNTGNYISGFLQVATWTESYTGSNWQNAWTVFYWGWWIAWSPFVCLLLVFQKGVLFVSLFWEFY
jgi:choline/glycine/proline betaine transport protein